MTDTTYTITERTSPDGKFTQYGFYKGTYFVSLAEFPAASHTARLEQWHDDPRNAPPKPEKKTSR
jgi:hypothetical protein